MIILVQIPPEVIPINYYGLVKNEYTCKLMCLYEPIEVTGNSNETLAYYESVMFYSIDHKCQCYKTFWT